MKNKRFFGIMIIFFLLITLIACSGSKDSPPAVVTAIAAGNSHTVALKNDGTILAWGYNGYGQLGDGTNTLYRSTPVPVMNLTGVTKIAAGGHHTVALKNDSTVWAWGLNSSGQLDDGTMTVSNIPVLVSGLTGIKITAIAAGDLHTVALTSDGNVLAWGKNDHGQLGDGTPTLYSNIPVQVGGSSPLTDVITISAGFFNTVALKNGGTVWAWGSNSSGEVGDGTIIERNTPVQVGGSSPLADVTAIAAGEFHTVALKSNGTVWAWGRNDYGQVGDGTTIEKHIPVSVSGLTGIIIAISAGELHTVALKNDGTVWAWGRNNYGQLGDGTTTDSDTPVKVNSLTGITAISAGESHTVALQSDGTLWAWGKNNDYGQLGDGTMVDSDTPVQVK